MKSIIVPKTSVPPSENTIVIQLTKKEAIEMLDVYESSYRIRGFKPLGYKRIVEGLENFIEYCKYKEVSVIKNGDSHG